MILCSTLLHKNNLKQRLLWGVILVYLAFILQYSVFSSTGELRGIRLTITPWFLKDSGFHESVILIAFVNMCLYIPYGYMLLSRIHKKYKYIVGCCIIVLSSVIMEALQYIFSTGITSLEDSIANITGGILGVILYGIVHVRKKLKKISHYKNFKSIST